jgi:2-oxo-hept-3-ene-1,7-dioate hydratase
MQYALNIDIPDSGILFDNMAFAHGATVPAGRFIQPRIVAEITFAMKALLRGKNASRKNISPITHRLAQLLHAALTAASLRVCGFDSATGSPVFRRWN